MDRRTVKCMNCGGKFEFDEEYSVTEIVEIEDTCMWQGTYMFCPHCGARVYRKDEFELN